MVDPSETLKQVGKGGLGRHDRTVQILNDDVGTPCPRGIVWMVDLLPALLRGILVPRSMSVPS